mmetsp:Transcript_17055/g.35190  ORF Transcript_17055/g.35190 Transcript_17055/m.35190 type:complete len:97 (-) Transcript_17055:108-398(-)
MVLPNSLLFNNSKRTLARQQRPCNNTTPTKHIIQTQLRNKSRTSCIKEWYNGTIVLIEQIQLYTRSTRSWVNWGMMQYETKPDGALHIAHCTPCEM